MADDCFQRATFSGRSVPFSLPPPEDGELALPAALHLAVITQMRLDPRTRTGRSGSRSR